MYNAEQFSAVGEVERLREENMRLRKELEEYQEKEIDKNEAKLLIEIQKCKIDLKKQKLKKSGYNTHNTYSYFELDDFIPCVEIILDNHGLASFFYFKENIAELTICNVEGASHTWVTKCVSAKARENGYDVGVHMKSEQAIQTYARRTLWLQAMEITELNVIENDGKNKQEQKSTKKQDKNKSKITADKLIQPVREENNETTAERIQTILSKAEKKFSQAQLKKLEKDRKTWNWENGKQYIKEQCKNEQEYNICKQSTQFTHPGQV